MQYLTYGILKTETHLEIYNSHYERANGSKVQGKNGLWGTLVTFKTQEEQRQAWAVILQVQEAKKRAAARLRRQMERQQTLAFYAQAAKALAQSGDTLFTEQEFYNILAAGI